MKAGLLYNNRKFCRIFMMEERNKEKKNKKKKGKRYFKND